jgi:SAM-dependent methyltransferase
MSIKNIVDCNKPDNNCDINQYNNHYTEYQLKKRGLLRRIAREYYLNAATKLLKGRVIDFGCGVGELLQRLPVGSVGLEINPVTVAYCRSKRLDVRLYDPEKDHYQLDDFKDGSFETLILNHVLEHLKNPDQVLRSLLQASRRLGIEKTVIIVPGKKGFSFDSTHLTYIDRDFFINHHLTDAEGFRIVDQIYFPLNLRFIENFFTHFEFHIIYEKIYDKVHEKKLNGFRNETQF